MRDFVQQAHRLVGVMLRDGHRNRQGKITGVDQSRDTPAVYVAWSGESRCERVALSIEELRTLVSAYLETHDRRPVEQVEPEASPVSPSQRRTGVR
ncbi:hypothetical protein [Chromohalobacter nigrandesensis]|uniref:hypothetical protein n=1 Tax=Chromohalobacter nigrandesensis TaxID=119863 RepID=UPI001FF67601|nr:hypothetical protein [Chromohalobacter nigrandesensis]MCK0744396.1 hypothetical protein [Chromohalobacter nigrandesensis]